MLDGILGRGFSSKCKSLIKLTRSRIDVIRRKRSATQKFLKKDIADLLSNGLDVNAYGRAEGLLVELRLSSCYDFVENCCEFLLKHLSAMQKQSGCPDECREAVSSLMFAAARFSDLPELRDLRQTFQERYGDSLEYFLNQEFAEKLAAKPCTMENKVRLMQDITEEFSIKWNARNFEQRMSRADDSNDKVSNGKETLPKEEKIGLVPKEAAASNSQKFRKRDELDLLHEQRELFGIGRRVLSEREVPISREDYRESPSLKPVTSGSSSRGSFDEHGNGRIKPDKFKEKNEYRDAPPRSVLRDHARFSEKPDLLHEQRELFGIGRMVLGEREMPISRDEYRESPSLKPVRSSSSSRGSFDDHGDGRIKPDKFKEKNEYREAPSRSVSRDEARFSEKPPKSEVKDNGGNSSSVTKVEGKEDGKNPYNYAIPPPYVKPNVKKEGKIADQGIPEVPSRSSDKVSENVKAEIENGPVGYPLPRPRSHRRRHSRSSRSAHEEIHDHEDDEKQRISRSRRREDHKKGLQILFDDDRRHRDDDERIIDKLLIHYSKKPPSNYEEEARSRRKSQRSNLRPIDEPESRPERREMRPEKEEEFGVHPPLPPPRSISLPREQPSAPPEPVKVYARAASFQPDRDAAHVHPKLPDYDDLAARFAALKGR